MGEKSDILLEVRGLKKYFPVKGGLFKGIQAYVKAVDGVSFTLGRGKTLGLVGESGCGKSTLGRSLLRLIEPTAGEVLFEGQDVVGLDRQGMLVQRRNMQIIFQDPYASLNPRMTIRETLLEPLEIHKIGTPQERIAKVEALLEVVGLRKNILNRYPHQFSGGQRQRIGIARALTLDPKLIVADEPVSALDVSVQSQVLNLISDLQKRMGIAFLFIAHDLAVVQHISHDVGVMYLGRLVELAESEDLYANPRHPYTQALLSAVPVPDPKAKAQRTILEGDVPSPMNPPSGCPFHTRCPVAENRCRLEVPKWVNTSEGDRPHWVACHLVSGTRGPRLASPAPVQDK